ncbi:MAG: hypothetical protein R2684_10235 [Pyrinomonadaceae bacterium]
MKNKLAVLLSLLFLVFAVGACSFGGLGSSDEEKESGSKTEKSSEEKSDSKSSSGSKVLNSGITECDELAQYIDDNSDKLEGNILSKGLVLLYKNTILKQIEESAEKMTDEEKVKMGEVCSKTLKQLKEQNSD